MESALGQQNGWLFRANEEGEKGETKDEHWKDEEGEYALCAAEMRNRNVQGS